MQDFQKICSLAHLDIPQDEMEKLQKDLEVIVGYVRQLDELDLDNVEPTVYGQPLRNVFREDTPFTWLTPEAALANAPETVGGEFKVPKIVE